MTCRKIKISNRPLRPLLALWLWLAVGTAWSAETNRVPAPAVFRVGMAKACFHNVNHNDAVAAFRAFMETVAHNYGYSFTSEVQIFDDSPTFETAIRQQPLSLIVMDAWQYLTMDIHPQVQPLFSVSENGKVGRKYLVLTRRDSGLTNLAALRGKPIVKLETTCENVGEHWLTTRLLSEKLGTPDTFFGSIEEVSKPTAAVLPVFFGKLPACVVDEASFEVMKELNPQVGHVLQVVAASDTYYSIVICLSDQGWISKQARADTVKALNDLSRSPAGQQIFTLFKLDKFVPVGEAQLLPVRKLQAAYEALQKQNAPASPHAP